MGGPPVARVGLYGLAPLAVVVGAVGPRLGSPHDRPYRHPPLHDARSVQRAAGLPRCGSSGRDGAGLGSRRHLLRHAIRDGGDRPPQDVRGSGHGGRCPPGVVVSVLVAQGRIPSARFARPADGGHPDYPRVLRQAFGGAFLANGRVLLPAGGDTPHGRSCRSIAADSLVASLGSTSAGARTAARLLTGALAASTRPLWSPMGCFCVLLPRQRLVPAARTCCGFCLVLRRALSAASGGLQLAGIVVPD